MEYSHTILYPFTEPFTFLYTTFFPALFILFFSFFRLAYKPAGSLPAIFSPPAIHRTPFLEQSAKM